MFTVQPLRGRGWRKPRGSNRVRAGMTARYEISEYDLSRCFEYTLHPAQRVLFAVPEGAIASANPADGDRLTGVSTKFLRESYPMSDESSRRGMHPARPGRSAEFSGGS